MASIRFSRFQYGRFIFGGPKSAGGSGPTPDQPTTARLGEYAIKIYNADGTKLAEWGSMVANNPILSLNFELAETGCGAFELKMGQLPSTALLDYGMRLDIHLFGDVAPWYSGYVNERPLAGTTVKPYLYKGFGFFQQLDWVLVNDVYENMDIAEVARRIIQDYVEPETGVTYAASKISNVGYSITKLRFDYVSAKEALKQLAEFATGFVYGVDERRQFFFRPRATEVNEQARLFVGVHLNEYNPSEDLSDLCNYALIKGGALDSSGSNILATVQDADSQGIYGLRKKVLDIPTAIAQTDAQRWGQAEISRLKDPKRRAAVKGLKLEYPNADGSYNVRRIKPDGKAIVTAPPIMDRQSRPAKWSDLTGPWTSYAGQSFASLRVYGEYVNVSSHEYPINKVKYTLSAQGVVADLTLGEPAKGFDDWYVAAVRKQKQSEILQSLNNRQLKGAEV